MDTFLLGSSTLNPQTLIQKDYLRVLYHHVIKTRKQLKKEGSPNIVYEHALKLFEHKVPPSTFQSLVGGKYAEIQNLFSDCVVRARQQVLLIILFFLAS